MLDTLVTTGTCTGLRAGVKDRACFIADRYDNLAAIPTLGEPLFLLHGTADDTVPVQMAQDLHKDAYSARRDDVTT